ncbi:MAG: hypothetical protein Q9218_007275 [Villophora microphyllina]
MSFGKCDPAKDQKTNIKLRQPGTGIWLVESQEFVHWTNTESAKLWLQGILGAGKTVLASVVIEEALRTSSSNHAVAFFYCDYKDPTTQTPRLILGSLLQQIAKQDKESFEKLQSFYDLRNPECKNDFEYDPQQLCDLISDVTRGFDRTTVIVDGLDECGVHSVEVTELLASLNSRDKKTTIKTLFLSRDEIDIREYLQDYVELAIAAKSSDLRLYVGAEIDIRMRKNKLRIKDQTLKGYIMEKLVEGAAGMFRWVTCQMDYLCELPNDASRRKALGNLPPTLQATYERILRRVNASSMEVELLVSRTLRWIICRVPVDDLNNAALCDAVSVNIGDTCRDIDSVSDETEILRWCSSLVRKAGDSDRLELAHFTVEEFLLQLDNDDDDGEFANYRVGPGHGENELAKVCLTYLGFCDSGSVLYMNRRVTEQRFKDYPLRNYAVCNWDRHARLTFDDEELLSLVKVFLNVSKTGTFMSWLQDKIWYDSGMYELRWTMDKMKSGLAEATVLHFASMLCLPEICTWLIESGCEVNRNSLFGSPLHCALLRWDVFYLSSHGRVRWDRVDSEFGFEQQTSVIKLLLAAGADPNDEYRSPVGTMSPLLITMESQNAHAVIELLEKGAKPDGRCLTKLEDIIDGVRLYWSEADLQKIIDHIQRRSVEAENYSRILKLTARARKSEIITSITEFSLKESPRQFTASTYGPALRAAAEYGQIEVVTQILEGNQFDIQQAENATGLTALHYAAMNDHLDIVKLLCTHRAGVDTLDCNRRTPVHHAVCSNGVRCLAYFLGEGYTSLLRDKEGFSPWHLAASKQTKQALETLTMYLPPGSLLKEKRTKTGWSPFLCAASAGSVDNIDWLLHAGCTGTEIANDGSTALHLAARSGSSRLVKELLINGSDVNAVTGDGSTVIHFALLDIKEELGDVLDILFDYGIDISKTRDDGILPIQLLIALCINMKLAPLRDDQYEERLQTPNESEWLLQAFGVFLARNLHLTRRVATDKSLVQLLVDMWQRSCSESILSKTHPISSTATKMMHLTMEKVSLAGSSHYLSNPNLTISALKMGDEELAHRFLAHFPNVDALCGYDSIITSACRYGCSLTLLEELLGRSEVQHRKDRSSGLVRATSTFDWRSKTLEYLLNAGFGPDDQHPSSGESALMVAARSGAVEVMKILLSNGASVHILDKFGCNVVHYACLGGSLEALQILRHTLVDWTQKGSRTFCLGRIEVEGEGVTPLHLAATQKENLALEYLLDESLAIDIDAVTDRSETPLYLAASNFCPENVSSLLSRNANATILSTNTGNSGPLHIATHLGYEAVVSRFLEYDCDVGILDGRGLDCEIIAKEHRHSNIERMLREYKEKQGVHISSAQKQSRMPSSRRTFALPDILNSATPLQLAAFYGEIRIATLLMDRGASPDKTDNGYRTPLHFAARENQTAMIEILLDHGANVHAVDRCLVTPSMIAAANGNVKSLEILKARGADFQMQDQYGRTALYYAATSDSIASIHFLIWVVGEKDLGCEDKTGISPLSRILEGGSRQAILFIIDFSPMLGAYTPRAGNIVSAAILNPQLTVALLRKVLKRLSTPIVAQLLKHRDLRFGTPLYTACTSTTSALQEGAITTLLDAGADIDQEGGDHGTALMGACAAGRLTAVKLLVAKGAKICYEKEHRTISAIDAAKNFPEIVRWLLVGRFTQGPRRILGVLEA